MEIFQVRLTKLTKKQKANSKKFQFKFPNITLELVSSFAERFDVDISLFYNSKISYLVFSLRHNIYNSRIFTWLLRPKEVILRNFSLFGKNSNISVSECKCLLSNDEAIVTYWLLKNTTSHCIKVILLLLNS